MEPSRITLLKRAFRSGSSEFWRARLTGAGGFSRPVLVKRLMPDVAAEPRLVERERAEALLTGRLVHPNILAVFDYCLLDGQAVTVLEDVRAVDLLHLLERATVERRRLAPRLALGIAWSVLNALVHAHNRADPTLGIAGIAHGDLSPSNILIDMSGRVLLRDFGIPLQHPPKVATDPSAPADQVVPPGEPLARLGRLHGKPGYMSPELVTRGIISPRSDVFAVGILLYELITFRRLFGAKDGAETLKAVALAQVDERILRYAGELPMPLRELMRRALKRQPDERFASAYDMLRALEAFFPGNPHEVAPELAHFVNDLAPPEDESAGDDDAAPTVRRRSGRRTPSRMILPAAEVPDESDFEAEFEASQLWANNTPLPLAEIEVLLANIEPVGPPPLPPEAGDSAVAAPATTAPEVVAAAAPIAAAAAPNAPEIAAAPVVAEVPPAAVPSPVAPEATPTMPESSQSVADRLPGNIEPGFAVLGPSTPPMTPSLAPQDRDERTGVIPAMPDDARPQGREVRADVIPAMPDDIFELIVSPSAADAAPAREPTFDQIAEPSAALLLFQEFAREVAIDPLSIEPPAIDLPLRKAPPLDPPPLPPPLPPPARARK